MTAQPNSHSTFCHSAQPIEADHRHAGARRAGGWLLAGLLAVVAVLALAPAAFAQEPIYVTPPGAGSRDGSSWANAATLQAALSSATSGDEIWVATGVYTPGVTISDTFTVTSGIQLYGGFAATETLRTQRDWVANPTVLSGDIGGDDTTDATGVVVTTTNIVGTNVYHVLWLDGANGDPITQTTCIDGFAITAGQANNVDMYPHGNAGGLYCVGGGSGNECSPSIANMTFSGNLAIYSGGAMYNDGSSGVSSPSLENVIFSGNSAGEGAAMYNEGSSGVSRPSLVNVTFSDNASDSPYSGGGAMYNGGRGGGTSSPSLVNVTFSGNSTVARGGAMYNDAESSGGVSSPSLVNVTFSGNRAGNGGAIGNKGTQGGVSNPSLVNVTFGGNRAGISGGAIWSFGAGSTSLTNGVLWGNTAGSGAQIYIDGPSMVISHTLVPSTTANIRTTSGTITWGPSILTSDPLFVAAIPASSAPTTGGNYRLTIASPAINAGLNSAVPSGVTTDLDGNSRILNRTVDMGAYEQYVPIDFAKFASPDSNVPNRTTVAYTLVLSNTGGDDPTVLLTDTLPSGTTFAGWIEQSGATVDNDVVTWSGALNAGESITVSFQITNSAAGDATITNIAQFSSTVLAGSATAVYTTSNTLTPAGSGNWGDIFPSCSGVCNYVIPNGIAVTLDQNIEMSGNLTIESGGAFDPNGKTVTLTGDQPQTLTGDLVFHRLTINKNNSTDTVTVSGSLKVSSKLRVIKGKLISASDYEDIDIGVDGELVLTGDITVGGNVAITGTLNTASWGITFDGAKEQNLTLNTWTTFDSITVYTGTTLIETVTNDHATINGTLTNYGTIRKSQPVSAAESYFFGLAGNYPDPGAHGMEIDISDLPASEPLTAIQVDRIDKPHPNAPSDTGSNIYWTITPTGNNFTATVTLPYTNTVAPLVCRYTGADWNCGYAIHTGYPDWIVSRQGVTTFSDWTVLDCSPTITVQNSDDNGVGSLRWAVAAACAGGVVDFDLTYPATITLTSGEIVIDKTLTIDGPGAEKVAVSGNNASRIFTITGTASIDGLTLRDGYTADNGGAIYTSAPLTLTAVSVYSSTAETGDGGALYLSSGGILDNILVQGNAADGDGGGIASFGPMTVTNSVIDNNQSDGGSGGGGIYVESTTTVISGTTISNNSTTNDDGGGICTYEDDVITIINSRIVGNYADDDGGGMKLDTATAIISNTLISGNRTPNDGGGIHIDYGSDVTIDGSTLSGNTAADSGGGIISEDSDNRITITNTNFITNTAGAYGGSIYNEDSNGIAITGSTFIGNTADDDGGAIYNDSWLAVRGSSFYSNTAQSSGGAIYSSENSTNFYVSESSLYANTSSCDGGAVYNGSALSLDASELYDNQASLDCDGESLGGAIYSRGTLTVTGSAFHGNEADGGGAIGIQGDETYSSTVQIRGSAFYENVATIGGAAVALAGPSDTRIQQSAIYSNTAGIAGGIASGYGGATLELVNTTLTNNSGYYLASTLLVADGDLINNQAGYGPDTLTLRNVTIADNVKNDSSDSEPFAAFVNATVGFGGASVAITKTIIAGGADEQSCYTGNFWPDSAPPSVSNLDNDGTCGSGFRQSDTILLGALGDYGSPVSLTGDDGLFTPPMLVFPLLPGSSAIDSGVANLLFSPAPADGACPATDQRGVSRPVGSACDIGAFESQGFTLVKTSGDNQSTLWNTSFAAPLAVSVSSGHNEPVDGGMVTFAGPSTGASTVPVSQTATIASGAVSVTVSANSTIGSYQVAASTSGASAVAFNLANAQKATTTSLQSQPNPSAFSHSVTITATVAISGMQTTLRSTGPTGQVRFSDESGTLATVALVDGVTTFAKDTWAAGTHTVTAAYLGDANYTGSTSAPVHQVVGQHGTATDLASAPNPSNFGVSVVMTATVQKQLTAMKALPPADPTGQVRFSDESGTLATVALVDGVATFAKDTWAAGTHTVTAEYLGDANYTGSTSVSLQQVVGQHGTATSLVTGPNPTRFSETVIMTATVQKQLTAMKALPPADPTGQVRFSDESGTLATVNLVDGVATFSKGNWASGTHTVTAAYLGDANYTGSTASPLQQVVQPLPTAKNDAAGTLQGDAVIVDPLANDLDPAGKGLTVIAVGAPTSGAADTDTGAKTVTYTPDPAFSGVDAFSYTIIDSNGNSDQATVAVVVTARSASGAAPQIGVVDNDTGSTLNFTNGLFNVQVQAPTGAYSGALDAKDVFYLAYTRVLTPTGNVNLEPHGFKFGNILFELSAYLNGEQLEHYQFPSPITVVVTYDPALLGNLREETLMSCYWNGAGWAEDGITVLDHDTVNHTLTLSIAHLTEFGFFASAPTAIDPGREPTGLTLQVYLPVVTRRANLTAVLQPASETTTAPAAQTVPTQPLVQPDGFAIQLHLPLVRR